ncbi:MAG: response regulator [Myxococcales bacterium]|nr:response regulator [Myxococcales bacterium]
MSSTNDLLSEVQDLMRFGIVEVDVGSGAVTWSDGIYRIYGWDRSEPPSAEAALQRVHPIDRDRVRATWERAMKGKAFALLEYRIVLPSGELRTLQVRMRSVLGSAGTPIKFLCVTQDVTEHKEAAQRLVFGDRMTSVGTLAGGVAHEINNPLAFISAHLELIAHEHGAAIPPDARTLLAETRVGVERISAVVRGLQQFASSDESQRVALEVERVLDLAVQMVGNQLRHRARLVTGYAPVPQVVANQATLAQVFVNLLVNAAEAIDEGATERNEVRISTRTDAAGWAIIEIADTGRGVPDTIKGQIFDPFFTTKPVGQGTGLGLSICHGIVRSLGGEIGFTSAPGAGSVFRIALPPSAQPARAVEPPPPAVETPLRRSRVLIVDDEAVFANALRRLLSRDRHDITIVTAGHDALARAQAAETFDVILCDLMMPAMSGMELHAQLAACAPDLAARMIFLTGGAFSPAAKQFLAGVPNAWFDKPCDLDALRSAIRRVAKS